MSIVRGACCRFGVGVLSFVMALTSPVLWAETSRIYDPDSQVYLSTDVLEAKVVRSYHADGLDLTDAQVTVAHKGTFEKGQTVVLVGAGYYRKPVKGEFDPQPLAAGDQVALFLVRVKPTEMLRIPVDAVIHTPLSGGMRLIQGDHVFSFSQRDITGAHVAELPSDLPKADLLTLERFREQLKASLRNTERWDRMLKQEEPDMPALLKLLSSRPGSAEADRDYFAEQICMRFAAGHDPELLSQALPLAKNYLALSILNRGFGTPTGREYLLAKVSDAKEPLAARLRYVAALGEAGPIYRETITEIETHSSRSLGDVDEGNSGYLARVAKVTRANAKHEELCRRLVSHLDYFGQGISQRKLPPLMADLSNANAVLKKLYETRPSQELQFAIERAAAWIPADYANLKSECGDFISILRVADPEKYTKPEKPSLIFEYEYSTLLLSAEREVRPAVVLIHHDSGKRHVIETQFKFRGWSGGGGSGVVEVPEDLPAGKYQVLFQATLGDDAVSSGHYFSIEL